MAITPLVGHDGQTQLNGENIRMAAFGGERQIDTTPQVQQEFRASYTVSDYRVYLSSWVGGAGADDMIAAVHKNDSDGNLVLTINATGVHLDTDSDSFVSGDLIHAHFDHTAGGHGDEYTVETYQVTLDAATDVPPIMGGTLWAGGADFAALQGSGVSISTEADIEYTMRSTRTLRDMRVYNLNYFLDRVITMRKNRADGGLAVTLTGTGEFLDVGNSVSYVAGDEAAYDSDAGGGSDLLSIRSVEADTSSGVQMWEEGSVGASTAFFLPSGFITTTTEVEAQLEAEAAATIQNLFVNCRTFAETRSIRTRKNGANGAGVVSVTGTGIFEDPSGQDSMVADDLLSIQQDAGSSGNNGYLIGVEWETTTGPPPTNKNQFWRRAGGVPGTWGRHSTSIGRSW